MRDVATWSYCSVLNEFQKGLLSRILYLFVYITVIELHCDWVTLYFLLVVSSSVSFMLFDFEQMKLELLSLTWAHIQWELDMLERIVPRCVIYSKMSSHIGSKTERCWLWWCCVVFRLIFPQWLVWHWTGRMAVHRWRLMGRRESRVVPPTTSTPTSWGSPEKAWRSCHLSKMGWVCCFG